MKAVTIQDARDLQPMDMVAEGVFIKALHFTYGLLERWEVAPLNPAGDIRLPVWGENVELEPTFPMTVLRGKK